MQTCYANMQTMPTPDWNDLRFFLAATRAGSLSGAARLLGVDQTTVGRRLAALEVALAARLFDRAPGGLSLTAAGERLVEGAQRVEEAAVDAEARVAGEDRRLTGEVRLATSETLAAGIFAELIAPLRTRQPGIVIDLVTGIGHVNLLRRDADLAVRIGRPTQPNLVARKLADLGWALYATADYLRGRPPLWAERVAGHAFIGYGDELANLPVARWIVERGGDVVLRTNSILSAASAATAGWGVAPLPCFVAQTRPSLVRALDENIWSAEVWLAVHPELERTARVRAVMDLVTELVEGQREMLRGDPATAKRGLTSTVKKGATSPRRRERTPAATEGA